MIFSCINLVLSSDEGVCKRCPLLCEQCSSAETCDRCQFGMFLSDGICVSTCEGNEYIDADFGCRPCDPSCQTCFGGSRNECMTCKQGHIFREGECQTDDQTCGDGYYQQDHDGFTDCLP